MPVGISGSTISNMAGSPVDIALNDLSDVVITPLVSTGQYLCYNGITSTWGNMSIDADIFAYIDRSLTTNDGIYVTKVPGPNTFTLGLGDITPTSVTTSGTISGSNVSGNNTGDQTITLTGDVTGSGMGTFPATLATVNSDIGTYGSASMIPVVTVNEKGLVTGVSEVLFSGTAPLAESISGGSAGAIVYQSDTNTTAFLSAGTTNQVLIGGLTSPSWSQSPAIQGTNFTDIPNSSLLNNSITIGTSVFSLGDSFTVLDGLTSITSDSFVGTFTGNAETASALANAKTIEITGDASWQVDFDGSANVASGLTLSTVNQDPQSDSFRRITVNEKGLVTETSAVINTDIVTALGYVPVDIAGDTMTGELILNADPVQALGAATKQYVDNIAQGIVAKPAVLAATVTNLSSVYDNGASGVGATLTASVNGVWPGVDGVTMGWAIGTGILVKNQTNLAENGRYYVSNLGSASTPWVLTRCIYCDTASEIPGSYVFVIDGSQGGTGWVQMVTDPSTFVVGTDPIYVYQFSGSGSITSGIGIDVVGNTISLATGNTLSLYNLSVNGLIARTSTNTVTARSIVVTGNGLSIADPGGVAGNPTISSNATSNNTSGTIVFRDNSGNFSAGTITATLAGNASSTTTVAVSDDNVTNANEYITWVPSATGNNAVRVSSAKLTFNPSTGTLNSVSFNATSTAKVKKAITAIGSDYVKKFSLLQPREYDRTDYSAHEFGFIAEEMAAVYPEIVGKDPNGEPSGIDYGKLSTILTAKIQEQEKVINELKSHISTIFALLKGSN